MHRPSAKDTQDDILRQHAEFLKQKSANKVELAVSKLVTPHSKVKDEVVAEDETRPSEEEIQERLANTFECVPYGAKVGDVVEHPSEPSRGPDFTHSKDTGFPVACRRDPTIQGTKTESIFELEMKKRKLQNNHKPEQTKRSSEQPQSSHPISFKTHLQKGLVQDDGIHLDNVKKIEGMSQEDIVRERENLIATMDPELIAFLKDQSRKRKVVEENAGNRHGTIEEQNEAAVAMDVDEVEVPILRDPNVEGWLNFDVIETNKLAWMKDVDVPKKGHKDGYEARFDFEGWLLPYTENEMTEKSRALYHHGEESGRPGYTLQELFQLSRSSVMQQAVVALNTIANILSLQQTGVYSSLDIPTEQIFFVIRHCLDDNTPSVLNACIKAMRNLIYDKIDETCLDGLLGFGCSWTQPILAVEGDDDRTINDQQLAENDLIKCLARTDMLVRIRYILNVVGPPIETVVYAIDILTRMARDSQSIVDKILQCDGLVSGIIRRFIVDGTVEQRPLAQAVKLMRVLACRNRTIARDLTKKYSVLDAVMAILSNDVYGRNANGMKLQSECLFFWTCLLEYDLGFVEWRSFERVLAKHLHYHLHNTDLDMRMTFVRNEHVAALVGLIGAVARRGRVDLLPEEVLDMLGQLFRKAVTQFNSLSEFSCGKLQLISSLYYTMNAMKSRNAVKLTSELLDSHGFNTVTKTITNGSMLLNDYETRKSSANLKTLEAAAWHTSEHVIPLVQSNSSVPFVTALSAYILQTGDDDLVLKFLRHDRIARYIDAVRQANSHHLIGNWFTRIEAQLIMNILKMSVAVRTELETTSSHYYELTVKSLSIFSAEHKDDLRHLMETILFNSNFYPSDVRLATLSLDDLPATSLEDLVLISNVYCRVLGLDDGKLDTTTKQTQSLDCRIGSVVPIDWIYTPILILYANNEENDATGKIDAEQESTIKTCLKWILIYETYFPQLAAGIDATDRFCRIACLFLGSDSLFLHPEIRLLLKRCLTNVLKYEADLNFDRKIAGLTDFQKFYTQMLEQYQAVSYGDTLFGNFVLVPLAQRHAVLWRKILWSEYMGVVETFNVTPEQCVCDLTTFLEPAEEDVSLLKCYRKGLGGNSIRKHTVLYKIARHHVEEYIKKMKNSNN